jgi:hypothetical protein
MSELETKLALEQDEAAVRELVAERGAALKRDPSEAGIYWLTLHPAKEPDEEFVVRIAWSAYPHQPPSVKFADTIGGSLELSSAWPMIPGYRPGEHDICQPFTAEAFKVHPDWAQGPDAWTGTGNPFLWVVDRLLGDMVERYQGRSA